MSVLFVIDLYQIDTETALVAEPDVKAIERLRQSINHHLKKGDASLLRIRFKSQALYERFKDFEGLEQVLPTQHLLPRTVLRNQVNEVLPPWICNELIVQLNLLHQSASASPVFTLVDKILRSCDPGLLHHDFFIFIAALKRQQNAFWELLGEQDIKQRLIEHFRYAFDFSEDLAILFYEQIKQNPSIDDFFLQVAYEQHQELLRRSFADLQINISLPPRSLSPLLLQLPQLKLPEQFAKDLPAKVIRAFDEFVRKIEMSKAEIDDIVSLIIAPWSLVLNRLSELIQNNSQFISPQLINKLTDFQDDKASRLADEWQRQASLVQYGELSDDATTEEALRWSEGYFESLRQQFSTEQSVSDELSSSFTEWLLKQSARISRSDADWRKFSKRVERFLQKDYLVVVCVVDALSALNQDLLLDAAQQVNHMDLSSEMLFAPLPTLTEVGKLAILTGTPTYQLPVDQEAAIRQRYQAYLPTENSLKIIKSWKAASDHIDNQTNLVVFFENRIDERLHDCVSFSKHRNDVAPILKQTMNSIEKWRKDAAYMNREVVFFVTADHGMTVTQYGYQGAPLGEIKERVFKNKQTSIESAEGFVSIPHGANNVFFVPKSRVRLSDNAMLTHGGITPEEVLVPFITLYSPQPEIIKTPLEIHLLSDKCCRIEDKTWEIRFELIAAVTVKNVSIKIESPFIGSESIAAIEKNTSQKLLMTFSAPCEQSSLTDLSFKLNYDRDGAHEDNIKIFSCLFPESLIEKDAATQGFEDMFS